MFSGRFRKNDVESRGAPTYPDTRIDGIALAYDGTPFATVSSPFSGAYSGTEQSVFIWNGARWREALPSGHSQSETSNFTLGAAQSPTEFVCNDNFIGTAISIVTAEHDRAIESMPHFLSMARTSYRSATERQSRCAALSSSGTPQAFDR